MSTPPWCKEKVMVYYYGNGDQMHVILNGEPLEEVDCFQHLGSQVFFLRENFITDNEILKAHTVARS